MKKETPQKEKPRYNIFQNSAYMIRTAWSTGGKGVLILSLITAMFAIITNLLNLFVTPAILEAIENARPLGEIIRLILGFTFAMLIAGAVTGYVNTNKLFGRLGVRMTLINRARCKASFTSYPNVLSQDFKKKQTSVSNSLGNNNAPGEAIWDTLTGLLQNILGLTIYILILTALTPWVTALVLATTVIGFFINRHINGWGYRHREESQEITNRLNYISERGQDSRLAKDIRLFGMGDWLRDMHKSTIRLYKAFIGRRERYYLWKNFVNITLTFIRNGVAYFYLLGLVVAGDMPASEFLLLFSVVGGFSGWVNGVLNTIGKLHDQSRSLSIYREFLDYPEPFKFEENPSPELSDKYTLEFRNVSFRYPDAAEDTITDINLTISSGEKLAIVGLNGAGKTTFVKLACGLLDPSDGEVRLNGVDIRSLNRREYYQLFTAVFQEYAILPVSIAVNIAQELPDKLDLSRVKESAAMAGLAEKIEALPKGYDHPITKRVYLDGTEFSGGETQRLLLARALYKTAPIVILDEPTAALDPIAESEIYGKYHELTGNCTSLYISHRLASTRFCDRVVFLDKGKITEIGTHEELLHKKGKYQELFELQSHYYKDNEKGA